MLLTLQILLAFLILFGVFAFAGAKFAKYSTPLGFVTASTYIVYIDLPEGTSGQAVPDLYRRIRSEVGAIDGVESVANTSGMLPFSNWTWEYSDDVDGVEVASYLAMVDEHFADAAALELVEGRWFTPDDTLGGKMGVVVNERCVAKNFPVGDVIGRTFLSFDEIPATIVGVVRNYKYLGEFADEGAVTFLPYDPWSEDYTLTQLFVRAAPGTPTSIEQKIFERVSEVSRTRESIVEPVERLREETSRETWIPVLTLLGVCAFLVANVALGLFGILINAIAKRREEIGLRKALGATAASVAGQFTLEVVLLAALGITLGAIVAIQVPMFELIDLETRFFWYGAIASAALILTIVVLCALIPSGQAARIHPAVALRED